MLYSTTNNPLGAGVTLKEAMFRTLASDGGLYMPKTFPIVPKAVLNNIEEMSAMEIAYVVTSLFMDEPVDYTVVKTIVGEVFGQGMPLVKLADGRYIFELFHGKTLAFKDIGGQFLASMFKYIHKPTDKKCHVLVSTTGNTGAAVANAFSQVEGVEVHVLYPRGVMTRSQEAMITTLGGNVHAVEVSGNIETCKEMISHAMSDETLTANFSFMSGNSLNIGRLIPQIVCFYVLYSELHRQGVDMEKCRLAIPCGNLSNLTAGMIASKMGIKPGMFLAACNHNNLLDRMVKSGDTSIRPTIKTLASSNDLNCPSNIVRVMFMCGNDMDCFRELIQTDTTTDQQIGEAISSVYKNTGYTIDPNTAVAYSAALRNDSHGLTDIVFATSHPAKSLDAMSSITGRAMELPLQLTRFMGQKGVSVKLPPTYPAFRKYLLSF